MTGQTSWIFLETPNTTIYNRNGVQYEVTRSEGAGPIFETQVTSSPPVNQANGPTVYYTRIASGDGDGVSGHERIDG